MRKPTFTLALLYFSFTLLLIIGCGGKQPPPVEGGTELNVPEWFTNLPEDPNYLYAASTATSKDLQHAVSTAQQMARTDIARQLEVKINSLFKVFREEVGIGEDSEFLSQTTDVSKSVTSKVLSGSQAKKTKPVKEGMIYRAYVLMEMPIGDANAALVEGIRNQQNLYNRFRASQAYQELEEEVEKFDDYKKQQGMTK